MTNEEAVDLASKNSDWHTQDQFEAIQRGEHPSSKLFIQVMNPEDAETYRFNIFDVTKIWPHNDYPLREVGILTLNKNPDNYFAQIEQIAFAPAHLVPGIEPSADPMLQARLFSYADSQRHRLGVNYQQIPVNAPLHPYAPFQRDGFMTINGNYGDSPNYPSSLRPNTYRNVDVNQKHENWVGQAVHAVQAYNGDDYTQANWLWEVLGRQKGQQENLVHNVAVHLFAAQKEVRERTYAMFSKINDELGRRISEATEAEVAKIG